MNPKVYSPWKDSDELIMLREGYRDTWYYDTLGNQTGGWGHRRLARDPQSFDIALAKKWFARDTERSIDGAGRQLASLPYYTYWLVDVLRSVNFQLGTDWPRIHRKTFALMQAGKFYDAAVEAEDSLWFKQTPIRVQDLQAALIYTQACYDNRKIKG